MLHTDATELFLLKNRLELATSKLLEQVYAAYLWECLDKHQMQKLSDSLNNLNAVMQGQIIQKLRDQRAPRKVLDSDGMYKSIE